MDVLACRWFDLGQALAYSAQHIPPALTFISGRNVTLAGHSPLIYEG